MVLLTPEANYSSNQKAYDTYVYEDHALQHLDDIGWQELLSTVLGSVFNKFSVRKLWVWLQLKFLNTVVILQYVGKQSQISRTVNILQRTVCRCGFCSVRWAKFNFFIFLSPTQSCPLSQLAESSQIVVIQVLRYNSSRIYGEQHDCYHLMYDSPSI